MCIHDRQEFIELQGREEVWKCLGCGEVLERYLDSIGG